ncbi:MAG: DUF4412 domain-containing protein [Bacteroidales bacterium]|nr:DUF4412 domain-containing protein [Bacteroidales bacterium]
MKKSISLFIFFALLCGVMTISAQKPFAGRIQFETSVEGTDDPNVVAAFAGVTTEYLVMGNNMKQETSQQGVGSTQITNGDYNISYTIIDISAFNMGKYYMELKGDELKERLAKRKYDYDYTQETKDIAGYKCTKVNCTVTDLESDDETVMVYWVTNDLNVGENINFFNAPGLKGFPLSTETIVETEEMNFTLIQTATTVKADKKIKESAFFRPSDAVPFDEMPAEVKSALGIPEE